MRIVFEISGDRQIERELLRVGERAGDMSAAFSEVVDYWIDETRQQFATEGRRGSGGWAPLAASTLRSKGRGPRSGRAYLASLGGAIFFSESGGGRILHETGTLERSLTNRNDPNMIVDISPGEVAWGSRVAYSRFHQTGTSRMPQRRPVEFTEGARRQTVRILQRHLFGGEGR